MTRKAALAFGIGASLMLAAGTASAAGTCGTEVAALQQQLGLEQGANATTGASDPGVQQPSPSASAETGTSTTTTMDSDATSANNSGANATIGASEPGVQQPQPEANAANGGGSDTLAQDNANSGASGSSDTMSSGSGTVTETSRVGEMNTAAGGHAEAITALKKAQIHADAGNEEACMTELNAAKTALGIQ